MPYWYEWRDLNPQSIKRQILSLMCIPFHHTRISLLYRKQSCKSTVGTSSEIRTHRISPFERDDFSNLSIEALVGCGGLEPNHSMNYEFTALPLS